MCLSFNEDCKDIYRFIQTSVQKCILSVSQKLSTVMSYRKRIFQQANDSRQLIIKSHSLENTAIRRMRQTSKTTSDRHVSRCTHLILICWPSLSKDLFRNEAAELCHTGQHVWSVINDWKSWTPRNASSSALRVSGWRPQRASVAIVTCALYGATLETKSLFVVRAIMQLLSVNLSVVFHKLIKEHFISCCCLMTRVASPSPVGLLFCCVLWSGSAVTYSEFPVD